MAFDGDIPEPAGAAEFFAQFEALGTAAALTFAAYLLGSFLSDLFGFVWYAVRLFRIGPIFGSPEAYPVGLRDDKRLRERLIRIQASEPLSPEGAGALDEVSKRAVRRMRPEMRREVDRRIFKDASYTVRGPGGPRWLVGRRTPYEPWALTVKGPASDEEPLALHVAAALGDELDTARFRLLSEERDLFHEVDRLSAEGEFRLAVTPPLAAVVTVLAASASALWVAALAPLYVLVLLGVARQEQGGDRIVYAIRAGKVRTPILEQLEAEAGRDGEAGIAAGRQTKDGPAPADEPEQPSEAIRE